MQPQRFTTTPLFPPPTGTPGAANGAAAAPPQTFVNAIFVPLVQNILGGGAVAGVVAILTIAVGHGQTTAIDGQALLLWCVLVGGLVTCVATIVRFFGDDVGLVRAAYRAGQRNRQLRVNALELELQATRTQLARLLDKQKALPPTRAMQEMQRVYKAAQHLIHWHFEQLPIDRRSCEQRNMSQGDWRRARHLLIAAGVMDENGMTTQTLPETLAKAQIHYQKAITLGGNAANFVSPQ